MNFFVPDFESDAAAVAEYEAALQREERIALADAERDVRETYSRRRVAVLSEVTASARALDERRKQAEAALHAYGQRYPNRVHGTQIHRPSFFQMLFSFGGASRLYNRAVRSIDEALNAQAAYRRHQREEQDLETWLTNSLSRAAADLREKMQRPDWLANFHAQPDVEGLWKRVQAIREEREDYERRLLDGDVTPAEQRARYMRQNKFVPLRGPAENVVIDSIVHFGDLSCWMFIDGEGNKSWLPYDHRLETLIDWAFDTYLISDRIEVKFSRSQDGRRLSALDQFISRFHGEAEGRAAWRERTGHLRADHDIAGEGVVDDPEDKRLLDLLATLVAAIV